MTAPDRALSDRLPVLVAGAATVVVATGTDAAAGGSVWHIATLGAAALVLAVLRLSLAGRHRCLFAVVSAALVAQPAVHATNKILPVAPGPPTGYDTVHVAGELSLTAVHVLLAAVILIGVAGAEQLTLIVGAQSPPAWIRSLIWLRAPLWRPLSPRSAPPRPVVCKVVAVRRWWSAIGRVPRRGPPGAARARA